MKNSIMKNTVKNAILGLLLGLSVFSFTGCASAEGKKQLAEEAGQMELEGNWWNNGHLFDSLEEAKHFVDVWFVKAEQITGLHSSKGLNGFLKPSGAMGLWTPKDGKVSVNWDFRLYGKGNKLYDLSKEELGFCHSAILYVAVWYNGKGIMLPWYAVEKGWHFSNNMQRYKWNDSTNIEYPVMMTTEKAWEYLGYTRP